VKRIVYTSQFRYLALACCLLFFASGWIFLPHLGLQNDEALFAGANYEPKAAYAIKIGHSKFPLMLMSYLGTVKSWLYRPIFQLFGTGIIATRAPMLLTGTLSVWIFYLYMRRAAGERAALIGCSLLAVDTLYLLTVCFDWGPVALQHLLLVSGLLLLLGFYQTRQGFRLFWGWFLLGLGMWDKALMSWMLGGIGLAALVVYKKEILTVIGLRRLGISALAFLLGALPLVIFNLNNHFATFRSNTSYDASDLPGKGRLLLTTADSRALFGWLVNEDWQTATPHTPSSAVESASARMSAIAGRPRHNLLLYAFIAALLLTPLARGAALRAILFALIAMALAWVQMAFTANAGGSVHHAILLWPLPQMIIAISFAAASRRLSRAGVPVLAAVVAVMMVSGLLLTNEYYFLTVRNGGAPNWTNAIFRLSDYMKSAPPRTLYCVDWGIMDSLRLLNRGKLPLRVGSDLVSKAEKSPVDRETLIKTIAAPENVFAGHTKDFEFFDGSHEKLAKFAEAAGYQRELLATIPDSYGRPVYEVYHFVAAVGRH
jgi:4-amino-4-deoxy-L-arabinose transferase-like glycosyltransferase